MRISLKGNAEYWVLCFVLLMLGALFIRDGKYFPDLLVAVDAIAQGHGASDPQTFANAAKDVAQLGWLSEANAWVLSLWPPGLVLVEAAILKLFGLGAPLVLMLQVLACAALAGMFLTQRLYLSQFVSLRLAGALPFTLFLLPMPRIFLFEPYGVVLGETFSVAALMSAVFLLARFSGVRVAVAAGILLAASAYFRSQYELILLAATGVAIPVLLLWKDRGGRRAILIALVTAHVVMLPWRLHNYMDKGNFSWVQTGNVIALNGLSSDEPLLAKQGKFVIEGAGNVACKVDAAVCDSLEPKDFYKTLLRHPVEWYSYKLSLIVNFWSTFTTPKQFLSNWFNLQDGLGNIIYLASLVAIFPLLIAARKSRRWPVMAWATVSMFGAFFVIFTLAHFEPRYFYLIKIFSFTMCVSLFCIERSRD